MFAERDEHQSTWREEGGKRARVTATLMKSKKEITRAFNREYVRTQP